MKGKKNFISKAEWERTKYKIKETPEYVNNFLHYQGLFCFTDHQYYYLQPDSEGVNELPDPNALKPDEDIRLFWVQSPLSGEANERQLASVSELWLENNPTPQLKYSEFFLKILEIFIEKKDIEIDWDNVYEDEYEEYPEEEEESTEDDVEEQEEESTEDDVEEQEEESTEDDVEEQEYNRKEGLKYLHLTEEDKRFLEQCYVFLLLKDQLFLMSPLIVILDNLTSISSETNPEHYFSDL